MKIILRLAVIGILLVCVASCGNKGELVLPAKPDAVASV